MNGVLSFSGAPLFLRGPQSVCMCLSQCWHSRRLRGVVGVSGRGGGERPKRGNAGFRERAARFLVTPALLHPHPLSLFVSFRRHS
jgi:hypothetical protein